LTFAVPLDGLRYLDGVRVRRLDEDHVKRLVESEGRWPPILVWERRMTVVDGAHRVAAAKILGMDSIAATAFVGSSLEAYIEAVRRNVSFGLPLTLKERTRAAAQMLYKCPRWSDRRISAACGLSANTVGRLRREATSAGRIVRADVRVGRDGRTRPVEPVTVRERIATALLERPNNSLRAIANTVGASPETVRSVRRSLTDSDDGAAELLPSAQRGNQTLSARGRWSQDPALASLPSSECFLRWFESSDVAEEWYRFVSAVPISRIYEVADEARRRSRTWHDFAEAVESRVRLKRA
jgi:hypothetical protein